MERKLGNAESCKLSKFLCWNEEVIFISTVQCLGIATLFSLFNGEMI